MVMNSATADLLWHASVPDMHASGVQERSQLTCLRCIAHC